MHDRTALAACLLVGLLAATAYGGGPRAKKVAGHDTFAKGTLEGLSLDDDGVLRPGPVFDPTPLGADTAWAALVNEDAAWIGTGNKAELIRVRGADKKRIVLGDGLMVTALVNLAGGGIAAAVFPGGRIFKVSAQGEAELFATLPVEHIWDLDADLRGGLVAACGGPGALYAVDAFGAPKQLAEVDDDHARCIARMAEGSRDLYVGTAPKGRVLSFQKGELQVVHDLDAKEVVGLVSLGDRGLLIAANADKVGGNAQMLANLLRQVAEPAETKAGAKASPRAALQDGSLYHLEPTGVLTTLWAKKKVAVLDLARSGSGAVAGTYPSGRIVRVEPGKSPMLLADLPEAEASVVRGGDALEAVVTSNPAVLHRRRAAAARGTWTSAPLDTGGPSQWGRLTLWGSGVKSAEFRSGPTKEPDGAWTDWKPVGGFDGQAGDVDARARFVQVRTTLVGRDASLRAVEIVTRTPNRAPVVSELAVKKPGAKKDAPPKADTKREITWKVADADGDRLRSTVEVNRKGSPHWTNLVDGKVLKKPSYTWDTTGVPDGIYQVAVTVDDGGENEPGRARRHRRLYVGLRVDNTAPVARVQARRHAGGRIRVEGSATDAGGGRIQTVRVSIDGGEWQPVGATDGLYDSATEAFQWIARVPESGAHDIVVQVTDADGNIGSAATVVK